MILQITPYSGAGCFKFGMSKSECEAILGKPKSKSANFAMPGEEWHYTEMAISFNGEGGMFQIGFDRRFFGKLMLGETDILRERNALRQLVEQDGKPYEWVGFVILLNLGMRLGGYHEEADEGRTVSLFERGRYNEKIKNFAPFFLKNSSNQ